MGKRVALIFGSTGAVGKHILSQLLANSSFDLIKTFGRRSQEIAADRHQHFTIDFDQLEQAADLIVGTHLFYCIGSTIKQAGSKDMFRKIDFEYGQQIAKIAKQNKVQHFCLVSSIGANSSSSTFYLKIKGQLEDEVKALNFPSTHIVQPSMLDNRNTDIRLGEVIATPIMKVANVLTFNAFKNYKPIDVSVVATALIQSSLQNQSGVHILRGDAIRAFIEDK